MKNLMIAAAGTALVTTFMASAAPAEAGPFDRLKRAVEDVEKAAEDVEEAAEAVETVRGVATGRRGTSRAPTIGSIRSERSARLQTRRAGHVGSAGPVPAKYTAQLKCASLGIGNAFVAREDDYTFSKGISTETRSGLVDRTNVQPTNGCFFGGLGIGDVLYVEFDKSRLDRHAHKIQCVSYDGSEQLDNAFGPKANNYKGQHVMLHTGNSLGYEPTASGSNSDRGRAYDALLESRGRAMATFNFESLHTDKSGTDFYCQWFNDGTGESAVAFTYRRGPAG